MDARAKLGNPVAACMVYMACVSSCSTALRGDAAPTGMLADAADQIPPTGRLLKLPSRGDDRAAPTTDHYLLKVEDALGHLDTWNAQTGYRTAYMTFNEYVTWGLFLVYAHQQYDDELFRSVRASTVRSMASGRGSARFSEFSTYLLELCSAHRQDAAIPDLYLELIARFKAR